MVIHKPNAVIKNEKYSSALKVTDYTN